MKFGTAFWLAAAIVDLVLSIALLVFTIRLAACDYITEEEREEACWLETRPAQEDLE